MGADIYLQSVWEKHYEQYHPRMDELRPRLQDEALSQEVRDAAHKEYSELYNKLDRTPAPEKGYFRDPYNGSGLFAILGL